MTYDAWGTQKGPNRDPMRPSLVARAKKRKTTRVTKNGWLVEGNASLGDSRDSYLIHRFEDGTFTCECYGNDHGDIRRAKGCSHVTGVMLWLEKHGDEWESEEEDDAEDDGEDDTDEEPEDGEDDAANPAHFGLDLDTSIRTEVQSSVVPAIPLGHLGFDLDPLNPPDPAEVRGRNDPPLDTTKFPAYRSPQWKAICEVVDAFQQGYKVVFVDAPTGAGKTLIAESVRRILNVRGIYTCTTKTLQDQTMRDFGEYARLLKGRSNYKTLDFPDDPDLTAADCSKKKAKLPACAGCPGFDPSMSGWEIAESQGVDDDSDTGTFHCDTCHPVHLCPYEQAKWAAKRAQLAVLNTSYLMNEANLAMGLFSGWELVIMDEADQLESLLFGFVEVTLSPTMRKKIGVTTLPSKTVPGDWQRWLTEEVLPGMRRRWGQLSSGQMELDLGKTKKGKSRAEKEKDELKNLATRIGWLLEETIDENGNKRPRLEQGWVLDGFKTKGRDKTEDMSKATVVFKPIKVDQFAKDFLFRHGARFLLMSASFGSVEQEAEWLGLEDSEWTRVTVPSSFPVDNRPIVVKGVANVVAKNKAEAFPQLQAETVRIIDRHPHDRILIHTVSYELTDVLATHAQRRVEDPTRIFSYRNAGERQRALAGYLEHPSGVIFAPSFDRGVDLHGEDCRVQVIVKVPYPYLGDAQISARANGTGRSGRIWYAMQTMRTMVQMTGRGMRSKDDWVVTYLLDKAFVRLYQENRRLFPDWWSEALVWDTHEPRWRWLGEDWDGPVVPPHLLEVGP